MGGLTLQQSTVVRWLSLVQLLESIVKSFKEIKRVLISRKQQSKLNGIDENILVQLIRLLNPFKTVLNMVQKTKVPSLYIVVICTHVLKRTLKSFDELLKYEAQRPLNESEALEDADEPLENEGK